jgi:hypothetical protein
MYVSRPEGDAVAQHVMLRGFDAEHGQDIEFRAAGLPINQVSHLHGQGYADLNFIIPEVVRSIRVTEGVYDPRQGDFAVAGSVDFDLAVVDRGLRKLSSYGSYGTFRQLVLWAPRGAQEETFGAVAFRRTAGFGDNRGGLAGAAVGQYAFKARGGLEGVLHVAGHAARSNLAGVVRRDDVEAGRVGFYDSYDDPSANAQSAMGARGQTSLRLEHRTDAGARTAFSLWFSAVEFQARQNFTGYLQRSQLQPTWVGRGDLIDQHNRDFGFGAQVAHRPRVYRLARWLFATLETGANFRMSFVRQHQNLIQVPGNQVWDRRVDAGILATSVGVFGDADVRITEYLRLRGGLRTDILHYGVDDRLANRVPSWQETTHLPGQTRSAIGAAVGPRAALELAPLPWLRLMAAYGRGYRSPQARQLQDGERAPFAHVNSAEGGVTLAPDPRQRVWVTTAGFGSFLSTDLAFDPLEGRLETIGPTRRRGVVGQVTATPWPWIFGSVSVTWVQATLRAPPAATPQDPTPAFRPGQALPYVPPVVVRADLGFRKDLFRIAKQPVAGYWGTGFSFLSARPLPYGEHAAPVALLDVRGGFSWRWLDVGVDLMNVTNRQWAASEYAFVSDWGATATPSMLPARHIAAGTPFTIMGTAVLKL